MKLEIKHLASYLPYDLKVVFEADEHEHTLVGLVNWSDEIMVLSPFNDYGRSNIKNCKPILRPLSDLTKEIKHKEVGIIPKIVLNEEILFEPMTVVDGLMIGIISDGYIIPVHVGRLDYVVVEKLFEWHFDVFGLIEKGLAVNINSVSI